jgi:hypothetical protein
MSAACGVASADDVAVIDLTGVKLQDGLDQMRSSAPDSIDPAFAYTYDIAGMVKGSGLVMGILFPNPTPLEDVLDVFQDGLSDLLSGAVENEKGTHPFGFFDLAFEGMEDLAGIEVTFAATLSAGVGEDDFMFFSVTDVVLDPSFLVGSLTFTEGSVTLTRVEVCYPDFNGDGMLNILDFVAFQNAFVGGDAAADCNGDGALNILDFVCFQNAFQQGCA